MATAPWPCGRLAMGQHFLSWTSFPFCLLFQVASQLTTQAEMWSTLLVHECPKLHYCTVTVPSHRGLRTEAAQAPYDSSVETAESAQILYHLCMASVQLCPGLSPKAITRNCMIFARVHYKHIPVARSLKNRRQINRMASGANVIQA